MKEGDGELSVSPAWLGKGHKRLQDSHESALGLFSWCVRAGIPGMRYVSTADTGMKTGNAERLQAPSTLEIAPAELWERRERGICAAKHPLLKGFLSAVRVSAMVPTPASPSVCREMQGWVSSGLVRSGMQPQPWLAGKGQEASLSHPNLELGDILSLASMEMIVALAVPVHHLQPSPRAEPAQGWALPFLLWMVFQSLLLPAMVMGCQMCSSGKATREEKCTGLNSNSSAPQALIERTSQTSQREL